MMGFSVTNRWRLSVQLVQHVERKVEHDRV
jgi:hypothetical protein